MKQSLCVLLSAFVVLTLESHEAVSAEVGWAKASIAPSFEVPLAGYGARRGAKAKGLHDPVYARAFVIKDKKQKIAVVSTDLMGINRALRDEVNRRLASLGLSSLLLFATHTHSGIGGYWDNFIAEKAGLGSYEKKVFDFLVEQIVRAVKAADHDTVPARIGSAGVTVHGLASNRRYGSGPLDSELNVIRIDDFAGKPLVAIVNFAAHATILSPENLLISADYPGVITEILERQFPLALFAPGASGDISPNRPEAKDMYEMSRTYGRTLAKEAHQALARVRTFRLASLKSQTLEVSLPRATLRGAIGVPLALLADPVFRLFAPTTTVIQAVKLNELLLTAWPGEVGTEVGARYRMSIQKKFNPESAWVISLANDYIGYIQNEHEFDRGGYETSGSFFGPTLGEHLTRSMLELNERVNEK